MLGPCQVRQLQTLPAFRHCSNSQQHSTTSPQQSCCTGTSKSFWLNLPLAVVLLASGYWLLNQISESTKQQSKPVRAKPVSPAAAFAFPVAPASGNKPEGKWKEQVNSPMVVQAWEALSGSIVQEVCWSRTLTRYVNNQLLNLQCLLSMIALAYASSTALLPLTATWQAQLGLKRSGALIACSSCMTCGGATLPQTQTSQRMSGVC